MSTKEIPEDFLCPITNEIMKDPVIDPDGNSYERAAIISWLASHQTSPITRNFLLPTQLVPNRALRNTIETFRQLNPEIVESYVPETKESRALALAESKLDAKGDGKEGEFDSKHADDADDSAADSKETEDPPLDRKPLMLFAVIDTSGSMQEPCGGNALEDDGYSRLDLVKHTFNTIVTSLSSHDYACVIKFSTVADVFIPLTKLTRGNKLVLIEKLKHLCPENQTNLWDALRLVVDEIGGLGEVVSNYNVQVYVLTDGEPNINPPGTIAETLQAHIQRRCRRNVPTIHTFAYGYNLDSDMLFAVSKVTNGSFGFIPDASMVGTVFINALANSLYPEKAVLSPIAESVCVEAVNVLYNVISARDVDNRTLLLSRFNRFLDQADVQAEREGGDMRTIDFIYNVKSDCTPSPDPILGQVSKATEQRYFTQWGKHYLRSVLSAYLNRVCINFKDKGLQIFKTEPFIREQKRIESVFVQLPPPRPSNLDGYYARYGGSTGNPTSMAQYYDPNGGCFSADSLVFVVDNNGKTVCKSVSYLTKGMQIMSKEGVTRVEAIVKIKYKGELYKIGGMKLTAYHPVSIDGKEYFPISCPLSTKMDHFDGYVYDVVLENRSLISAVLRKDSVDDKFFVASFGHTTKSEIFSHDYFGSELIIKDLQKTPMWESGYIVSEAPVYLREIESQKIAKIVW